jgi:hypothetical protein
MSSFDEILAKMEKQTQSTDYEVTHSIADKLLVQLVKLLAADHSQKEEIETILTTYQKVGKWHA